MARGQHGDCDQASGADRTDPEQAGCFHFLQQGRTDEASHHGSSPVERDEAGSDFFSEATDFRLSEIIDQETSDRNLRTYINKDRDRTKDQVGMLPDGIVHLLPDFVLGVLDLRQLESADGHGQQHQGDPQSHVWCLHTRGFVQPVSLGVRRSHSADLIRCFGRRTQNEEPSEKRRQKCTQRVKRLREVQSTGGGFGLA